VGEGAWNGSEGAMDGLESSSLIRRAGDGVYGQDRPTPKATVFLHFHDSCGELQKSGWRAGRMGVELGYFHLKPWMES